MIDLSWMKILGSFGNFAIDLFLHSPVLLTTFISLILFGIARAFIDNNYYLAIYTIISFLFFLFYILFSIDQIEESEKNR